MWNFGGTGSLSEFFGALGTEQTPGGIFQSNAQQLLDSQQFHRLLNRQEGFMAMKAARQTLPFAGQQIQVAKPDHLTKCLTCNVYFIGGKTKCGCNIKPLAIEG